ncbi:asparagine synthase (glutamine-hydrolyzing) [Tepidibacillus fermentans]|uniref:asparagine synthase (glutamine-hydrolyzing) n=1 Tax=Tepidibacillus fermentans TaxID=1281767 RepID=A0A4V2UT14_9BACI|nr:asparagine synthase (glutamine-hydrolyzing) [Tepidibacillus fermentans]TCS83704.1 asparagine synthase (glutamine-hydrolysing) [Tepidibacillus fermentans]
MCGITGWIDWELDLSNHRETIIQMGETMKHRGPDASGVWVSKRAALAHTRLIVIDPEGGKQPMIRQYGENQYVITYNGELYNTNELRKELESLGHHFHSHSDTEVLLVSYIEWGEECVEHLNGIFAFGVWDEQKQQLFLARDRLGVKPLFYTKQDQRLIYGSEIKALLAHPDVHPIVDSEGLSEVFGLGPSRTPGHGVFKGIEELRPGHSLLFSRQGMRIQQYWKLESKKHTDDLQTTIEKVRELVIDAVKRQLVSDVPVCTFLSGGLDSSFISAIAAEVYRQNGKKLNTYSVDYIGNEKYFKESEFQPNSDLKWIERMVDFIQSNHHYVFLDNNKLFDSLVEAVRARDLPGMADVDSSLFLFSQEIKKNATVALSGECADEIFGGYPWFYRQADLGSNTFPWLRSIEQRERILTSELLQQLKIKDYVDFRYRQTLQEVPRLENESNEQQKMRELFYLNMTWFMATLLERKDRMTMRTGLEVRVPFADHRLVEYVWNIPWEIKNLGHREKGLLRKALKGILPDDVLFRKKSPYPKTHNPTYTSLVSKKMLEILHDSQSPILSFIDLQVVKSLALNKSEGNEIPWFGQLMTGPQLLAYLIQVDIWLKEYKVSIEL